MKRSSPARARACVSRSRASGPRFASVDRLEPRTLLAAAFDQTQLTDMRLDPAFFGIDGSDVTVAVLDSGIFGLHPQLRGNVQAYYNAVTTPIPNAIDVTSVNVSQDLNGHGTHVAGTVAAQNSEIGVAPAAKIVSVKVLADAGEQQIGGDSVLRGLQFVRQFANQFNIKVVNMSLGLITANGGLNLNDVPDPDARSRAVDDLEAMGITVVSASGNSFANDPTPGASVPAVFSTISVASTWASGGVGHDFSGLSGGANDQYVAFENSAQPDRFAASSQRSTLPNQVAAPGVDIFSTWNGSPVFGGGAQLFNTISGTSMAAPFVSGLVALMQDAAMTFGGRYLSNPAQILDILKDTADPVTDSNVADNGRYRIQNGFLVPSPLALPETGETFLRVNALNAVRRVRALMVGNTPGGDLDSTAANATTLPQLNAGTSVVRRGRIGADGSVQIGPNDIDLFRVTVGTRGDMSILLTQPAGGAPFSPSVRLFNAGGFEIARGDAVGGIYPNFRTDPAAPLDPGVYYVGVSSLNNVNYAVGAGSGVGGGNSEGDYALTVSINNPDFDGVATGARVVDLTVPDTLAFATEISSHRPGVIGADDPLPGSNAARILVPGGDVDMYRVVAPDNGRLQARTLSRTVPGGKVVDTYVRVFDQNLVELAFNDDVSPGNFDSLAAVDVVGGQTYYVGVSNFANRTFSPSDPYGRIPNSTVAEENYSLYMKFTSGDVDGTAVTAAQRTVGTPVSDTVGSDGGTVVGANGGSKDVDFGFYTVPSAGLLDLQVTGTGGLETVLALWAYNDAQHTIVKLGEAAGASPRLTREVTPGQRVYASVTGRGNVDFNWFAVASGPGGQTGAYTLNSALLPLTDLATLSDGSVQSNAPDALTPGVPVLGALGFDNSLLLDADLDVYAFTPAATGRYDVRTDTSAEGSADTVLRVFDAAGNPVASNDNANSRTNASALRVALTGGQTYYVGVSMAGANAAYDVMSGAGVGQGSRGTYGLTVNPAAAGAPAVVVADAPAVSESFLGGSVATFTINLDAPSTVPVTVAYLTSDGSAAAGADYTATTGTVTFAPGETSKTVTVPITGDALGEGQEAFGLDIAVLEGDAVVGDDRGLAQVVNQPVQPVAFNSALKATFTDADGGRVTVSLKGPGSGEVLLLGGTQADAAGITLTGTTAASVLTIKGATSVGDVTVNGSLRGLVGSTLDLIGNMNVAGTLSQLKLRSLTGRSIGLAGGVLSAVLGSIGEGSISTAGAIKSLKVGQWVDNDASRDGVAAGSIGSLTATGDFGADVTAGSIGKLTVNGNLIGSDVRAGSKIGTVRLGAATGSRIFAGVRGDVATLPDGADDFVDPAAAIGNVTITGRAGTFSNTMVAAPSVGRVLLGQVQAANGGAPFGVAADVLKAITTPSLRLSNLADPGASRTDGDFNVRIF